MTAALVELEQRAGASDADRDAWLAERRGGITATEVRDLFIGAVKERDLIAVKLGWRDDVADLSRVPVIGHGKRREVVIAEQLELRFAIAPETRVLRAVDNDRFLASPDGCGVTFDGDLIVSEIKTAGMEMSPGSIAFAKKGYLFQMIWVMRVTGARRCLFAWEERIEVAPKVYEPGELHFHWIDYDEAIAEQLEALATTFLEHLDAAASADYVEPVIDDELDTLAVNLLRYRELEKEGATAKTDVWQQMLDRVEGCDEFTQSSLLARVTWSPGVESDVTAPDVDAAKAAAPDLFAEYEAAQKRWAEHQALHTKTTTVTGKSTLTVTQIKQKAEKK